MTTPSRPRVAVVGAGVGGVTAAALLARWGAEVTVLEAHVYPGGCAGTFFHQGYRFDAGATLAGGFSPGGPMDIVARATGVTFPTHPADPAMDVLLPDGTRITRWTAAGRWAEEQQRVFGPDAPRFWAWQERTADAMWSLATRLPSWPPQGAGEALSLAGTGLGWLRHLPLTAPPALLADAASSVARHLSAGDEPLRQYVDGQLMIAGQATSQRVNALYGAAALDLPRRDVVHLDGGMGTLAGVLAQAVTDNGGTVRYRHAVTSIQRRGAAWVVATSRGEPILADAVLVNLPDANLFHLLGQAGDPAQAIPADGWGAFTLYLGIPGSLLPPDQPLHTQVIGAEPLGEGNSVFLSFSAAEDAGRAPDGMRTLTISTHTTLAPWWRLFAQDRSAYEARKDDYTGRLLTLAERAVRGLRESARLILPGTPVTFQRYTRRLQGWVGGYPMTSLVRARPARVAPGLWRVGDSIFPGQSTAAVALGGLRIARQVASHFHLDTRVAPAPGPPPSPVGQDA